MTIKLRIDGPNLLTSTRLLSGFFADPVTWYVDLRDRWGDIVSLRAGLIRMTVCFDVELLEQILVGDPHSYVKGRGLRVARYVLGNGLITSEGEEHRSQRKLAAPVFTPRNIEPLAGVMVDLAKEMVDSWPSSGELALADECYHLSLRVAGRTFFGVDFDVHERARLHRAMQDMNEGYRLLVAPGGSFVVRRGLSPLARRMRAGRDHVDAVIRSIISNRRQDQDAHQLGDLLSRLLSARDEEDGSKFSSEQLRDQAVTMLLAGHDTTAATLSWCLGLLAQFPHEQASARRQVDEVLGGPHGRLACASDLSLFDRVRAVVDETLRLHPAVYSTVREPVKPIYVNGKDLVWEPGTDLVIPIGAIHRDPRHWEDPLEFRPQRFLNANRKLQPRLAYMPFGAGPRVCIGASFALQELVLVLATILQHFEIHADPHWKLEPHVGFIRRPKGELRLKVKRRSSSDAAHSL